MDRIRNARIRGRVKVVEVLKKRQNARCNEKRAFAMEVPGRRERPKRR